MDVEWCPYISTVFANVAKDGRDYVEKSAGCVPYKPY